MSDWVKTVSTYKLKEILDSKPDDTATHIQNGNYTRIERGKYRTFHVCGGCCYAYYQNGCKENNRWSRHTNGFAEDAGIPLESIKLELMQRESIVGSCTEILDYLSPLTKVIER